MNYIREVFGGLFVLAVWVGVIVWLIVKEVEYHKETGDSKGWRLTLIVALITLLFYGLIKSDHDHNNYYGESTGDTSGWEDR